MPGHVRDGSTWKEVNGLWVRDSSTWKEVLTAHVRDVSTWKEFYAAAIGTRYEWGSGSQFTLSNGNLTATRDSGSWSMVSAVSAAGRSITGGGKYYYEIHLVAPETDGVMPGLANTSWAPGQWGGYPNQIGDREMGWWRSSTIYGGQVAGVTGGFITSISKWTDGDVCGVAVDFDETPFLVSYYKNNTHHALVKSTWTPTSSYDVYPMCASEQTAADITLYTGSEGAAYEPPSGYSWWGV